MPHDTSAEWERVLSAAAHLQQIFPDAVLVGGSAAALYAQHRLSTDADHVLSDLRNRFDAVLGELESVAGWKTARLQRPVQILGSLDGIETGVRQLIREEPLETTEVEYFGSKVTVPTEAEILRIKGVLILKRNATRDYLDFAALVWEELSERHFYAAVRRIAIAFPRDWEWPSSPRPYTRSLSSPADRAFPYGAPHSNQLPLRLWRRHDPR
jgi:hypothetical protein